MEISFGNYLTFFLDFYMFGTSIFIEFSAFYTLPIFSGFFLNLKIFYKI